MHPGLVEAQGPALIVYIEGPALSSEIVCQVLSPPTILPPIIDDHGMGSDSVHPEALRKEEKMYPQTGKRLLSAFAITDCLQVITGKEFLVFDPCGQYLLSAGDENTAAAAGGALPATAGGAKGRNRKNKNPLPSTMASASTQRINVQAQLSPRAQRCFLVRRDAKTQDVLTRFPDQFAPHMSLPFRVQSSLTDFGQLPGVLIRMVRKLSV